MHLNQMSLNQFKYKITYSNNMMHTKITSLNISISRDNTITVNNHTVTFSNNKLITDLVFLKNQYNTLLELFENGFIDYLKYLNSLQLKVACNYINNRDKGSFIYVGTLNNQYKKLSSVYKNLDDLITEHKIKLKKVI